MILLTIYILFLSYCVPGCYAGDCEPSCDDRHTCTHYDNTSMYCCKLNEEGCYSDNDCNGNNRCCSDNGWCHYRDDNYCSGSIIVSRPSNECECESDGTSYGGWEIFGIICGVIAMFGLIIIPCGFYIRKKLDDKIIRKNERNNIDIDGTV